MWIRKYAAIATMPDPGIVIAHVLRISTAFAHRTERGRSDDPIPIIDELTTCVVDTGAPVMDALRMTAADVN